MAKLFAYLQFVLPKHFMTAVIWRIARVRHPGFKNFLIKHFIKWFDVETDEVKLAVPDDFATFNEFFIRELADDARPIDPADSSIVSPVDGTVSIATHLSANRLIQAKGIDYTLDDLLATDLDAVDTYRDGNFATLYLAPYNYHRVHAPLAGELIAARYVPGDLFSVNAATAKHVNGLFRRNERLVMHFDSDHGPYALIFVGALMVGSISTPWSNEIRPLKPGTAQEIDLRGHATRVDKGELLGWFNMGSTVILLSPKNAWRWADTLQNASDVTMGERIGQLQQ